MEEEEVCKKGGILNARSPPLSEGSGGPKPDGLTELAPMSPLVKVFMDFVLQDKLQVYRKPCE